MIRKIIGIYLQIKFLLLKKYQNRYSNKNDKDVVNQLIEKGLIPDEVKDQYLKEKKTLNTSNLIEALIKKRIEAREQETNRRYSKIINEILQEKINR